MLTGVHYSLPNTFLYVCRSITHRSTYSYISLYPLYKVEKVHVSEKASSCHFMLTAKKSSSALLSNIPFLCLQPKHSRVKARTLTIGTKPEPFFREMCCPMSAYIVIQNCTCQQISKSRSMSWMIVHPTKKITLPFFISVFFHRYPSFPVKVSAAEAWMFKSVKDNFLVHLLQTVLYWVSCLRLKSDDALKSGSDVTMKHR